MSSNATASKKWINSAIAIAAILVGYIVIRFVLQLGEWFDLEAKVKFFAGWAQGLGFAVGLISFIVVAKNQACVSFLEEVYGELVKVVWPEKEGVAKLTIGIVIGLIIVSIILGLIDYGARFLLSYLY